MGGRHCGWDCAEKVCGVLRVLVSGKKSNTDGKPEEADKEHEGEAELGEEADTFFILLIIFLVVERIKETKKETGIL